MAQSVYLLSNRPKNGGKGNGTNGAQHWGGEGEEEEEEEGRKAPNEHEEGRKGRREAPSVAQRRTGERWHHRVEPRCAKSMEEEEEKEEEREEHSNHGTKANGRELGPRARHRGTQMYKTR